MSTTPGPRAILDPAGACAVCFPCPWGWSVVRSLPSVFTTSAGVW
ncbi:hypothetical protein [Streptomyces hydrogenans]